MPLFASVVRRHKEYKDSIGERELTKNERNLEQVIFLIGEHEIGKLTEHIVELEGEVKTFRQKLRADKKHIELEKTKEIHSEQLVVERQRTQFAILLGNGGKTVSTIARGAITPWHVLLGGPSRPAIPAPEEVQLQEVEDNEEPVLDNEENIQIVEPAPVKTSRFIQRLLSSLPAPVKACVMPVATFFTTLSPLSSAILILAFGVGAFGWAEWSKSSLREMKTTLQEQNTLLTKRVGELEEAEQINLRLKGELQEAKGKSTADGLEVERLNAEVTRLKEELTAKDEHVGKILSSHKEQLDMLKSNADEGFKKVNSDLEQQNAELRKRNDELNQSSIATAEELGRLRPLVGQIDDATKTLSNVQSSLAEEEKRSRSYQRKWSDEQLNVKFLRSLVQGMKQELDTGLLTTTNYGEYYRKRYRDAFNQLLDAHFDYFSKQCNLKRYVTK